MSKTHKDRINYLVPYLWELVKKVKGKPCRDNAVLIQEEQIDICRFACELSTWVGYYEIDEQCKNLAKELSEILRQNEPYADKWFHGTYDYFIRIIAHSYDKTENDVDPLNDTFIKALNSNPYESLSVLDSGVHTLGHNDIPSGNADKSNDLYQDFKATDFISEEIIQYLEQKEDEFYRLDQLMFIGYARKWSQKYAIEEETLMNLCEEILQTIEKEILKKDGIPSEIIDELITPFLGVCVC